MTIREVEFAESILNLHPGDQVLDLACGSGRHSCELARRGYRVVGLDQNAEYLAEARQSAVAAGVDVEWVASDMRTIPVSRSFEGILCMFTSFGYLEDDAADAAVLEACREALAPGGRLLLDLANVVAHLRSSRAPSWERLPDGTLLLQQREFDPVRGRDLVERTVVSGDGEIHRFTQSLRMYTFRELSMALVESGFAVTGVWGNYDLSHYAAESARMLVRAERPPDSSRGSTGRSSRVGDDDAG